MALREKTIEFAVSHGSTTVVNNTVTNLAQFTVFIPEASPTFKSVYAEVSFRDLITVTGGTITEHRVGLRLGAAGYTTYTELDDITHSGENMGGIVGPVDFTSHFTANWSGTSMTCDTQVYFSQSTGTTLGMTNVALKLTITYEYDDTAATQIKTVRIPFDSLTGALAQNSATGSHSTIPQLTSGGILPEAGVTIRDWFVVIEGNEANSNTTNWTLNADLGGAQAQAFGATTGALNSACFARWIYRPGSVPDPTTTHNLRLWGATLARANYVTVTLYVTYEFTLSGTTRTLNSVLLPVEIASPLGANTTADASRFTRDFMVLDPGTITMRHSAIRMNLTMNVVANHNWRVGGQAYRTYTSNATLSCGMYSVQQRFDSGGAQGAGLTLNRGKNTITIDGYGSSTTNHITNICGVIILNYESDVAPGGIGQNTKTLLRRMFEWDALLRDRTLVTAFSVPIIEANYWLMAAGFCITHWTSTASEAITFDVQCLGSEAKGAGFLDIYADAYQSATERGCSLVWTRGRDVFKRFPQDADTGRLDIESARTYRLYTSLTTQNGIISAITYHSFTWAVAGSISGHNASLTTDVKLFNATTGECMQTQTLGAGTTAFSFTVYDNTEDYYVVARQNDTLVGRSGNAKAA